MEHYKICISQHGKSIEISSHEKEWVEKKEKEYKDSIDSLLGAELVKIPSTKSTEVEHGNDRVSINSAITINEFYRKYIHSSKIKSLPDISTYFIYYLEKIQDNKEFGSQNVKGLFKSVGYPNANKINISDVLARAKKKAFLNNYDNQWTLTITGEDFVLNTMSKVE